MMLQSAVLAVGAYLVIHQQATAGIIIAGSILSARALAPVDLAIANWQRLRRAPGRAGSALDRAARAAAAAIGPDGAAAAVTRGSRSKTPASMPPGSAEAGRAGRQLSLKAGKALGIIGPSGSGKSLAGAHAGRRLAAGARPHPPRRRRARSMVAGGARPAYRLSAAGRRAVHRHGGAEHRAASTSRPTPRRSSPPPQAAGVHDLIVSLADGYETQVGEHGSALSAGQAQRIALARALYGDPFLVVLDEPNSNLDAEGDEALTRAILGVRARGGIVVVVAHRPSAIAGVDYMLVMARGRPAAVRPERGDPQPRGAQVGSRQPRRSLKVVPESGSAQDEAQNVEPNSQRLDPPPHASPGVVIVAFLAIGVGGWASTAEISGALIAQGSIVVDSNVKKVQHPTGGVVGELRVRDGDRVKAGDILVRLDETVTRANLAIVTKGLTELYARKARLAAERDGAETLEIRRASSPHRPTIPTSRKR